jgi:aarF domain-containing kinase
VHVPKLMQAPTKKMLIMEYIHGFHIDEVDKMRSAKINMKEVGKRFSQVIVRMIHKYGFVHADPHSGNLLVRKNSKGQDELYLLDHGLYQELDEQTREDYNWFWLGLILNKEEISVKAANRLGTKNGILLCSMLTSQTR